MSTQDATRLTGLVLTRKEFETVLLDTTDGQIEVMVTKIKSGRVRLRFACPASVRISRGENPKYSRPEDENSQEWTEAKHFAGEEES